MKTIVKKIVKIILTLILIFYVINVAKNFYLYFTYKHGDLALIKVEGQPNEIEGRWKGISDHWHGADEMRLINEFNFNSDSTGIYHEKTYSRRINGKSSEVYSWRSILPFDKNAYIETQYRVFIDSLYITLFPDSNTYWKDTVYTKYKISNDSLYIDQCVPEDHRYTEEPCWTHPLSYKILDYKELFIPYIY
jgi:hypothetical protein